MSDIAINKYKFFKHSPITPVECDEMNNFIAIIKQFVSGYVIYEDLCKQGWFLEVDMTPQQYEEFVNLTKGIHYLNITG